MNSKIISHKYSVLSFKRANKMRIWRLKAAGLSAIIIMATFVSLYSGLSLLMDAVTIHSSGSIGPVSPNTMNYTGAATSEIRALFVHSASMFNNIDWETVAQTLSDYSINTLIIEGLSNNIALYPSAYISSSAIDHVANAISAAHPRGIKVYVLMDVLFRSPGPEYQVELASGTKVDTLCPTKVISRTLLRNLVEEISGKYDIDGFMFDYTRYDAVDTIGAMCYCAECKAKMEGYLGETIVDWPGDFAPGGSRFMEFMEWRIKTITELVRDMRSWILAVKPDVEMSAAVWGYWPGIPTTNRWRLGQDFIEWLKEGYLDWVAPMVYMTDIDMIGQFVRDYNEGMGGPEGIVPLVIFLSNAYPSAVDPANFKAQIDTVRANGADGWAIWRYGGPGDNSGAPDIRDYLDLIDLYPHFSIGDINVSPGADSCTITWTTDLPTSSKVEYGTSPLFTSSFELLPAATTPDGVPIPTFNYWDIDHVQGTIVEDATPVTNHSVTLTDLQEETIYYFRVQSEDQSGTATSKVCSFATSG